MEENTFYRKVTLQDFDPINTNNKHTQNRNDIRKNQEEFGHKKRIKP
jgi:hypothetical protein